MANSAFDHTAAITVPSSSTNTGVVTWSGTGGNTLLDSTVLVSGNNITIPGTITFGGTQITSTAAELNLLDGVSGLVQGDFTKLAAVDATAAELNLLNGVSGLVQADLTKLAAIDSTAAEVNLLDAITRGSIIYGNASGATALLGKGTNGQVLTSNATDVLWADAAGGGVDTTGTPANNQIATFTDADTLQGEASLTFDNAALAFDRDHDGNNAINLINDSNTSSASTRLTIQTGGASAGDAVALFHAGGASFIIGVDNSDENKFKISGTGGNLGTNDRITILGAGSSWPNEEGYVGIGTSAPVRPLDVVYASSRAQIRMERSGGNGGIANIGAGDDMFSIMDSGYTRHLSVITASGGTLGHVGLGLANTAPSHRLHVVGGGGWLTFLNATTNTSQYSCLYAHTASEHSDTSIAAFHSGSSYKFKILGNGNVTNGASTTYHSYSDERIKENIVDSTYGLTALMSLRPVKFNYQSWYEENTSDRIGFIAQEVKVVVPEIVKIQEDSIKVGDNDAIDGMHSIEDQQLIPILVKAIQELKAEIDELKG